MAFYDHFIDTEASKVSYLGEKSIDFQNNRFIKLIKKYYNRGGKIKLLEIGPGKGFFAKTCKKNNFSYTAIEINKKMCVHLEKEGFYIPLNEKQSQSFGDYTTIAV